MRTIKNGREQDLLGMEIIGMMGNGYKWIGSCWEQDYECWEQFERVWLDSRMQGKLKLKPCIDKCVSQLGKRSRKQSFAYGFDEDQLYFILTLS